MMINIIKVNIGEIKFIMDINFISSPSPLWVDHGAKQRQIKSGQIFN